MLCAELRLFSTLSLKKTTEKCDGKKAADKNGIAFFECSAKKEIRVDTAFEHLARQVLETQSKNEPAVSNKKPVIAARGGKKNGCC